MDTRSFISGVIGGALAGAVATWMFLDKTEGVQPAASGFEAEAEPLRDATAEHPGTEALDLAAAADHVHASGEQPGQASAKVGKPSADARDHTSQWLENARDQLAAEPKDTAWSYYMEQAIVQFLAEHPAMSDFEISHIDCRTTLCQIQVAGFAESTGPTWNRIMYDLSEQPWDEFGQRGSSSSVVDGRLVLIQNLHRK